MKIVLDIPNNKVSFAIQVLKSLSFVKQINQLTDEDSKKDTLENVKSGLEELRLFKKGKLKTTSAKDFLNEL